MKVNNYLSEDHIELASLFNEKNVEYLLVGGTAVAYYGYVRATYDVDFFYRRTEDNIQNIFHALDEFFGHIEPELRSYDRFMEKETIFRFGTPPNRVELLNEIDGVSFDDAWENRGILSAGQDVDIPIISLSDLLENKQASPRAKDQADYEELKKIADKGTED